MSSRFERTGSETLYEGPMFAVRRDQYRHEDGEEVTREIVDHAGAVGVVAHDGERLYLVAHAREAVDEPELLELPAGKLDEEGESRLDTAKRELAEEIGQGAERWEELPSFFTSVGVMDERVHLYLATGGASDANALEVAGLHCVNLANGTEHNHEPGERVSVAALEGMLDVALALLDEAAAVPLP